MRLGWHIGLPGPFSLGGTVWRSKSRRRGYHGTLPGWKCPHNHSRPDLARACADREARRRAPVLAAQRRAADDMAAISGLLDGLERDDTDFASVSDQDRELAVAALDELDRRIAAVPAQHAPRGSQRKARQRVRKLRERVSGSQAATPAAPAAAAADSPATARRRLPRLPRWLWAVLALAALGIVFATHGLILIPAVVGAVVAVRRGKLSRGRALVAAAGLTAVLITGSVLTWGGSSHPASAAPAPSHSAPASPAPSSHAPASHAPASHAPASHAPASHAPASQAPATQAPASQAPASQAPASQAPASQAPAPAPAPASAAPASVYRAGEYCSAHGATAVDAHGSPLTCSFNNGWRWEH